jgi:hypothetical protein
MFLPFLLQHNSNPTLNKMNIEEFNAILTSFNLSMLLVIVCFWFNDICKNLQKQAEEDEVFILTTEEESEPEEELDVDDDGETNTESEDEPDREEAEMPDLSILKTVRSKLQKIILQNEEIVGVEDLENYVQDMIERIEDPDWLENDAAAAAQPSTEITNESLVR